MECSDRTQTEVAPFYIVTENGHFLLEVSNGGFIMSISFCLSRVTKGPKIFRCVYKNLRT